MARHWRARHRPRHAIASHPIKELACALAASGLVLAVAWGGL